MRPAVLAVLAVQTAVLMAVVYQVRPEVAHRQLAAEFTARILDGACLPRLGLPPRPSRDVSAEHGRA